MDYDADDVMITGYFIKLKASEFNKVNRQNKKKEILFIKLLLKFYVKVVVF